MNIDFNKGDGLVPAIIQDAQTMQVLMLGYMNREGLYRRMPEKLSPQRFHHHRGNLRTVDLAAVQKFQNGVGAM